MQSLSKKKIALISLILAAFIMIMVSYSSSKQIDIQHIRQFSDEFNASTTPYEDKIRFKLTIQDILSGIQEPRHLETIKDTDVYLKGIRIKEKESENEADIYIDIGLESNTEPSKGTLLSLFKLNENDTYTTGSVEHKVYNKEGKLTAAGDYGGGGGDSEGDGEFDQHLHFLFEKSGLLKSDSWTFEVSGLYLMEYTKP